MLNLELREYIDSIESYTLQALYDIGMVHKKYCRYEERDWNSLLEYLLEVVPNSAEAREKINNWKTGEPYRTWVLRKERRGTEISNVPSMFSALDSVRLANENSFKKKALATDAVRSMNNELRAEARGEELVRMITSSVRCLKPLPSVKYKGTKNTKGEAVLMLSDLHIGLEYNLGAREDCFQNNYNLEIAKGRVNKLVENTIMYCKRNCIDTLHIVNLGDLISGIIHTSTRIMQQMDVADQVAESANIVTYAVNRLKEAAPHVTYRSCSDNHGRFSPNLNEALIDENFGKIVDIIIKERLKDSGVEFKDDNIYYGLGKFTLQNGKVCMFAHGHEDNITSVVQNWTAANAGVMPNYLFMGHYHNSKMKQFNGSKVFINGSICGTDQYALKKRLFGKSEQTLVIFDADNVIDIIINLDSVK